MEMEMIMILMKVLIKYSSMITLIMQMILIWLQKWNKIDFHLIEIMNMISPIITLKHLQQ